MSSAALRWVFVAAAAAAAAAAGVAWWRKRPRRPALLALAAGSSDAAAFAAAWASAPPAARDAVDEHGRHAVHLAASQPTRRGADVVGVLLASSARLLNQVTESEERRTPLHLAAAHGCAGTVSVLLDRGAEPLVRDGSDVDALAMAACNGHNECVARLLATPAVEAINHRGTSALKTPLHFAAGNGHRAIVAQLVEAGATVNERDAGGSTALALASMSGHIGVVRDLLAAGADPHGAARDGSTALTLACRHGRSEIAELLMTEHNANLGALSCFGMTAMHEACARPSAATVGILARRGDHDLLEAADYDGLTPLHTLCKTANRPGVSTQEVVETGRLLLDAGANPNGTDYVGGTPLLTICFAPRTDAATALATELLARGANPTIEYDHGWSPLHAVLQAKGGDERVARDIAELLREHLRDQYPEFLSTFDAHKPRTINNSRYHARKGAERRIPQAERDAVLDHDLSLAGIARYLQRKPRCKVVVLCGAGISTSAGIPDYRSASGIYSSPKMRAAFDARQLMANPAGFFASMRELFAPLVSGDVQPTAAHRFLKLLHDRGCLQRVYTQNVDGLEVAAGVPSDKVVPCHGTIATWRCADGSCAAPVDPAADVWPVLHAEGVPKCKACGLPVRPDVVFFGEAMPKRFAERDDLAHADLLLVMGTTLNVYPFAGLVKEVPLLTPRVLLNKEPSGLFRGLDRRPDNYRDVFVPGLIDESVAELVSLWDRAA